MSRKTKKGGRYVGKGTYGCGFVDPALLCEDETVRAPDIFSKLMKTEDAEDEFAQHELLKSIDPEQQYLLYPFKMCKPKLIPNENATTIEQCTNMFNRNLFENDEWTKTETRIIQYKNGGPDLANIKLKPDQYSAFFRDFAQLFEGLDRLHKKDVVHLDIKIPNIVCQLINSSSPSFQFRFIDFGLAVLATDRSKDNQVYDADYAYFPFEMKFISPRYKYSYIDTLVYQITILKHAVYLPNDIIMRQGSEYETYFETLKKGDETAILKGADIFALGFLLADVYGHLTGHRLLQNNKIETIHDNLKTIFGEFPEEWRTAIANTISIPIFNLVKKMMAFDFRKRITLQDALIEYNKIMLNLNDLFPEGGVEAYLKRRNYKIMKKQLNYYTTLGQEQRNAIEKHAQQNGGKHRRKTRRKRNNVVTLF